MPETNTVEQPAPAPMPTVATLACVLPTPTTLDAVSILRLKESDRLEGIELARLGQHDDLVLRALHDA